MGRCRAVSVRRPIAGNGDATRMIPQSAAAETRGRYTIAASSRGTLPAAAVWRGGIGGPMKSRMLGLAALLALSSAAHYAETADKLGITPIQAELMADLNTRALKVGATVFARVTAEWQGADCALRNGAILEAHVLSVVPHTKTAKDS